MCISPLKLLDNPFFFFLVGSGLMKLLWLLRSVHSYNSSEENNEVIKRNVCPCLVSFVF